MCCSLLWAVLIVAPLSSSVAQKRYLFRTYTVRDGLPHNTIFSINQDRKGYLWVATDGGIARFDGYRFDNSVMPEVNSEQAFSQYIDRSPSGRLAFATFMNGVMAEQDDGSFRQYLRHEKQLGKNVVRTLKWLSDETILFSESRNVNLIAGDTIRQLYDRGRSGNLFQTLEHDRLGNIWFGGLNGLGILFAGDTVKEPYYLPEMEGVFVVKLLLTPDNRLLAGTDNGYYEIALLSARKGDLRYIITQPCQELRGQRINHLYRDRQGDVWVSLVSNGLMQIRHNHIIRHITQASGLPAEGAMCLFQDSEENYWVGTTEGISRLYSLDDYSYTHDNKQLKGITLFEQDRHGRLWLFAGTTLYLIDHDRVGARPIGETPFAGSELTAIAFVRNTAWFFTDAGLYSIPCDGTIRWEALKKEIDFRKQHLQDLKCFYFDDDDNRRLWMGFNDGLYTYAANRLTKVDILSGKPVHLRPKDIVKDRYGYYWVGDYTFGLHRFEEVQGVKEGSTLRLMQSYESLKPDSAFATAWVQDLMLDRNGDLWLSSLYTGAYRLHIDENGVKDYRLYSTAEGLSSNDITQITEGPNGSIWFATRNGADRLITAVDGRERIIHYNEKNGLGRYVYQILPDDSITYISYEEGFFAVNSRLGPQADNGPLNVIITGITVMGKTDTTALLQPQQRYRLPYYRNFISFAFTAIRLKNNEGIEYQTMLEGIDREWSPYSDRHYASYNSLPHGRYSFRVRARMINSDREEPVTTFRFTINRPWYLTGWFFLMTIALLATIGYFIYINHIRHLLKLQRLRTKIAADLHDDIGSTLSSISIMSDILQSQLDNTPRAGEMIQTIGINAHDMLESMDDIIWSVNPSNDVFRNLALRVREYAIFLFESKDIRFQITTPAEMDRLPLPMDLRRNIFLIVKEAVNNLVKYADCTEAVIRFGYSHSFLTVHIRDNGKGFEPEKNHNSRNGLKNMTQRATQIRGSLSIVSEPGKGTEVSLTVKII
jgi:ligand-binding sensor domain-containing protein